MAAVMVLAVCIDALKLDFGAQIDLNRKYVN